MRPYVRCALVATSVFAAVLTTVAPAQAATGPWVEETPAPFANVQAHVHGTIAGHAGNWHVLGVDVDGDDDGVNGGLSDWQCPDAATELNADTCTELDGWVFYENGQIVVTWSPGLRYMKVVGPVTLEHEVINGELKPATLNLRIRATGDLTRTVTIQANTPTDDIKVVDASRTNVTVSGRLGWTKVTDSPSNTNWPVRVVRTFHRGTPT
jgi:hypothetical protein